MRQARGAERSRDRVPLRPVGIECQGEHTSGPEGTGRCNRTGATMKTDDLIAMLGTNVEPVDGKYLLRAVGGAIAASSLVAVAAILLTFGFRADLATKG